MTTRTESPMTPDVANVNERSAPPDLRTLAHPLHPPEPLGPAGSFVLVQWREPSTGDMVYRDEGTYATLDLANARVAELRAAHPEREYRAVPVIP